MPEACVGETTTHLYDAKMQSDRVFMSQYQYESKQPTNTSQCTDDNGQFLRTSTAASRYLEKSLLINAKNK